MTTTIYRDERLSSTSFWLMTLVIPICLAAGVLEQSANHAILPDEESYRSDLSETILESSDWRKPPPPTLPWREPPQPKLHWRTAPDSKSSTSQTRRHIELFPKYRPGRTTDFDHIKREEKPLIKVFEFGS